ncbi:flippase [Gaetbulibacter sp. PBL-D1]|uniref:flippase n=1 Tax=Gaetbulibacter sp. PBL-D1 TaxID=3422594 RepID=UPI003D2EDED5
MKEKALKTIANKDLSEIMKKGLVALFIRILGFIAGYIFIFYTVKLYGAETQGRLALSFSFMIIGALFCRLGVDTHFVKIFAINNNFDNARGIYFRIFPFVFWITCVVSLVVYMLSDVISTAIFGDQDLALFLKWTAPCIMFFTFILLNAGVFRGLKKNALYSFLFNGGRFVFTLLFLGVMIFFGHSAPESSVKAHTLGILVLFLISLFYVFKYLFPFSKRTNYDSKTFVLKSLPMLFSASMIVFLGWSDTIILGIYRESSIVGVYSVILKIAAITSFTFQAIDSILAPKLSSAFHDNNMVLFKKLVKFSTLINLIISIIVVIGIFLFKDIILRFFGEEFRLGATALIILCIGQLFNAICGPVGSILQMTGRQNVFQNILFIALIINISLNLLLVSKYGINGVATATAASLAFWNIVSVIYIRKKIY